MAITRRFSLILIVLFAALTCHGQNQRVTSLTVGSGGISNATMHSATNRVSTNWFMFGTHATDSRQYWGVAYSNVSRPYRIVKWRNDGGERGFYLGDGGDGSGDGIHFLSAQLQGTTDGVVDPRFVIAFVGNGDEEFGYRFREKAIEILGGIGGHLVDMSDGANLRISTNTIPLRLAGSSIATEGALIVQLMGNAPTDSGARWPLLVYAWTNHNNKVHSPFGVGVAQFATSSAHSNTVWMFGDNPYRQSGLASAVWAFENAWNANGQVKEMYPRFDPTGAAGDHRPIFMIYNTNGTFETLNLKGDWYFSNISGVETNYFQVRSTIGINAGNHTMRGALTMSGDTAYAGAQTFLKLLDRGFVEFNNADETVSYWMGVWDDNKSLMFRGNQTAATNVLFTNWNSIPVIVGIPRGGLEIGPGSATVTNTLIGTASLDFGSIGGSTNADLAITVTGTTTNDFVQLCVPWQLANTPGLLFTGFPSNDAVWVRCTNNRTNAAVDPVAAVVRTMVTKVRQ